MRLRCLVNGNGLKEKGREKAAELAGGLGCSNFFRAREVG